MSEPTFWLETNVGLMSAVALLLLGQALKIWAEERARRKRERINFLTKAYMDLEFGHPRTFKDEQVEPYAPDELAEMYTRFNKAMVAINLMGSPAQIQKIKDVSASGEFDFTELTVDLRNSLRKELGLPKIDGGHYWMARRQYRKGEDQ
nr:hypothetical protein [uncultured Celeribacter sp.]